ncbi:hypothetical protein QBC46DRAFT_122850 [Diplogelasinospora grovesii]|uniref:Uncharacterized protein n=1 Tax=Diplogelasinospora grovesii TaxID=303347 RepID=A0AAN6NA62_9PEZI|nr:hypothetical protein QBC46DRAFT_122850 [Diplogelasinospora grovesii]
MVSRHLQPAQNSSTIPFPKHYPSQSPSTSPTMHVSMMPLRSNDHSQSLNPQTWHNIQDEEPPPVEALHWFDQDVSFEVNLDWADELDLSGAVATSLPLSFFEEIKKDGLDSSGRIIDNSFQKVSEILDAVHFVDTLQRAVEDSFAAERALISGTLFRDHLYRRLQGRPFGIQGHYFSFPDTTTPQMLVAPPPPVPLRLVWDNPYTLARPPPKTDIPLFAPMIETATASEFASFCTHAGPPLPPSWEFDMETMGMLEDARLEWIDPYTPDSPPPDVL